MQVITSLVAPRARRRALLASAAAAAAALAAGAATAPNAHAAFTLNRCEGSTFAAQGSSFQTALQATMKVAFENLGGCNGAPAGPTYNPNGSGNGNAAMGAGRGNSTLNCVRLTGCTTPLDPGVRDPTTRLSGSDEPPNPTQQAAINAGTSSASDDGAIHLIPVATGASVLIMHVPEGCVIRTVTNKTNGTADTVGGVDTGDGEANLTQRIRVTSTLLEKAFAGDDDADRWGEIAPGISGNGRGVTGDASNNGVPCANIPVRRIVRQDASGTTFSWKAYLDLINPGRGWLTTYSTPDNTKWPIAGSGAGATPKPIDTGAECDSAAHFLCSARSSNATNLTRLVANADGAIGYSDLATARGQSFDVTANAVNQDYTFWSPLQTDPARGGTLYAEPTADAGAHIAGNPSKGANCTRVAIAGAPTPASSPNGDPTQGDWSRTFAAGGASYPACVLTYLEAWDDNAPVYGNTADEQAKARTVRDYLELIVSTVGQNALLGADYSPLPNGSDAPLLTYAQNAVNAISWNKAAGSGGGGGGTGNGGGGTRTGTGGGGGSAAPPSNQFSLPSSSTSARGLLYTVQLPGAGLLRVVATARVGRRTIRVGSVSVRASASGRVRVKLSLSAAAKRALARARSHKLRITVKFTFTPNGGSARTVTKTVTVRAARRAHRRGGRR
jgi:ABC-type phosphate transport system substrate-binding protein